MVKEIIEKYLTEELTERDLLVENFNEKSLQHNLGEYLKQNLGEDYIVQYERNIHYFKALKSKRITEKKEIDLVVLKRDTPENFHKNAIPECMIEIKFIRAYDQSLKHKKRTPTKELVNCLDDICFVDECRKNNIGAFSVILSDLDLINSGFSPSRGRKPTYPETLKAFREGNDLSEKVINDISAEYDKFDSITPNCYSLKWYYLLRKFNDEEGHELELKYILN